MFRQSPSRNQRSRGIKVKHVLQICVLLAVCFWLIYQVKHSHDKKKEFDESNANISQNKGSSNEILRLGRKDLQPRVEATTLKNEKHDEEAEEEETTGEEENKHEEEEQDEDNKTEEKEDEGREDGDDEIDERDQEKSDGEVDHEENLLDEDKEKEEGDEKEIEDNDAEDKDNQMENDSSLEDHDHDGRARNTHEAREEHYKADDASSAVTHDTQTFSTENENGNPGHSKQHTEMNILEQENKLNNPEELNVGQNMTALKEGDVETIENRNPLNTSSNEEKGSESVSSKSEDSSSSNIMITNEASDQLEQSNNSTEVTKENNGLALLNGTKTTPAITEAQNVTVEGAPGEGSNLLTSALELANDTTIPSYNNSNVSAQTLDAEALPGESKNNFANSESVASEDVTSSNTSAKAEDSSGSSMAQVYNNTVQNEKSDASDLTDEVDRRSDPLETENADEVQHDPIDTNDSSIPLEEQVRTDLETLPEILNEGSNSEDAAAE